MEFGLIIIKIPFSLLTVNWGRIFERVSKIPSEGHFLAIDDTEAEFSVGNSKFLQKHSFAQISIWGRIFEKVSKIPSKIYFLAK